MFQRKVYQLSVSSWKLSWMQIPVTTKGTSFRVHLYSAWQAIWTSLRCQQPLRSSPIYQGPPLNRNLRRTKPVSILTSHFFKIRFNIILLSTHRSPKNCLLPSAFWLKFCIKFSSLPSLLHARPFHYNSHADTATMVQTDFGRFSVRNWDETTGILRFFVVFFNLFRQLPG
jgi:hypothetical protein